VYMTLGDIVLTLDGASIPAQYEEVNGEPVEIIDLQDNLLSLSITIVTAHITIKYEKGRKLVLPTLLFAFTNSLVGFRHHLENASSPHSSMHNITLSISSPS
jgi:hypothetical protein